MPAAEDYTGLGALAWELFSGDDPGVDYDFFRRIIQEHPGPALDVGCGTGRLLVPLLCAGLEVEGVDPSADMLAICRRRAADRGLAPMLYQQRMEAIDLSRAYQAIFVPCGTIQLIVDRADASEALRRCAALLAPGGVFVLTVYNRWEELAHERLGEWIFRARKALPDGTEVVKHARTERRRLIEQTLEQTVRYQRFRGDELIEEQLSPAPERWYFKHEMELMLQWAGLHVLRVTGNYTDAAVRDEDYVMAFIAQK